MDGALARALQLHRTGRLGDAEAHCQRLLEAEPDNVRALNLLGMILSRRAEHNAAVLALERALALAPDSAETHYNLADVLREWGTIDDAIAHYEKAAALDPRNAGLRNNLAAAYKALGKLEQATEQYRQALALAPDFAIAHTNLGNTLREQGKLEEALGHLRRALELEPESAPVHRNLGAALRMQGKLGKAVTHYERALALDPRHAETHSNLGVAYQNMGALDKAIAHCRKAVALKPDHAEAHNNLGAALGQLGRPDEALAACRRALELKPALADAHCNLGLLLADRGQPEEAALTFRNALAAEPDHGLARAMLVDALQRVCDWQELETQAARLDAQVDAALASGGRAAERPFTNVVRCGDPARNLMIAKSWSAEAARRAFALSSPLSARPRGPPQRAIRIGYLSCDFHDHATAHLVAGLFGLHDREGFEIQAYSYGPDDGSDYRKRIAEGCDRFIDVRALSALEAARRIHEDGVDILVDLKGHTKGARLEICALRPAPVQVAYLGYPGSTGAEFFDYVITDRVVTPEDQAPHYSEEFAYLPHCYQVNDHTQAISEKPVARADFGLPPEESFVFCSFNQPYKIEPVMWDVWMRLLLSAPESALWLYCPNETAAQNLRREAAARAVDAGRLVFADNLPKPEHLARLKLADLFLDTRICNGHTTTSDALWAGLPVLTLQGRHFASRVASSLLTAIGLEELITYSLEGYEALAARLACRPAELGAVREKLARNRLTEPLFDTPRFARGLEEAYRQMWALHLAGETPRMIEVLERAP